MNTSHLGRRRRRVRARLDPVDWDWDWTWTGIRNFLGMGNLHWNNMYICMYKRETGILLIIMYYVICLLFDCASRI